MKISIISTAYPLRGGIAHFVGLLYRELKKENEVSVVTFKRQYPKIFFPGKSQLEAGDETEKIPSRVSVDSVNPFNWLLEGLRQKSEAPDLIIFKYWMPFFAPCFYVISALARLNGKTKVLVVCDNVLPHERKPGDKMLTKLFFSAVDYFILLSNKVLEDLLSLKPAAAYKVLPHPVYSNFGQPAPKKHAREKLKLKDEKLILFFGFIRDYKGLDLLLEALAKLKDSEIKLIVAGEFYTDKEKYLSLIEDLKIGGSVRLFTDFIPSGEVKYYFSACDAVILPYKSATQSGIVQIAMNFRKPVIATDVGGLKEVVLNNKTGFIVDEINPEKLAEAIQKFYNENREAEFVANIECEVEKYSWNRFTEGIYELTGNK
jgi:glycosyltransferase involved in cell wall biosynthesis